MTVEQQLTKKYGLQEPKCKNLNTLANDSYEVVTSDGHFALKVYNATARIPQEIQWELDLTLHLVGNGAPVAHPVAGINGNYLQTFSVDGKDRVTALFEWAAGEKPKAELSTYVLLGEAAARIHTAADNFTSDLPREEFDAHELFDDQLRRIKKPLDESGQWQRVYDLTERMRKIVGNPKLNYGVIHNDLTLDNIHLHDGKIVVFDFDSAAKSWRAAEPWGVLKTHEDMFKAWLEGYRSVRVFSQEDEQAVAAFVIIEDIRNVVWKLGFARSSRGKPLMQTEDIPGVVDDWLEWESQKIKA
jgi:Ser/Thr protein kinase RdoA (MazF antagonist)